MKRAVITGASGFLGRALVKELVRQGISVCSVVHRYPDALGELVGSLVVECELSNYNSITEIISDFKADVFYHLAWSGSAGPYRGEENIQIQNVKGTCDAVRLAAKAGCKKFIFASSVMEYEVDIAIKSMRIPGINSIYSTAKIAADYMARIISGTVGIDYISALISNVYGPGEISPRLINSSIRTLLRGKHLSLSAGLQLYDFIYITDAAKMFAAIGKDGKAGKIYYIGNREVKPLRSFMEELRDIVSPDTDLGFGDIPFSGISLTYEEFDKNQLYQDTGFIPKVSFSEGIQRTKQWLEKEYANEQFFI